MQYLEGGGCSQRGCSAGASQLLELVKESGACINRFRRCQNLRKLISSLI